MRIALVSHACIANSGSRAPVELAKSFSALGQDVYFYAYKRLSEKNTVEDLEKVGVKVILVKTPKIMFVGGFVGCLKLANSLRNIRPDVVSTQATLPFVLGSRLSGFPVIFTYMGTQLDVWLDRIFPNKPGVLDILINNLVNFLIRMSTGLQLAFANHTVTFSKYCAKEIFSLYGRKAPYFFWGGAPSQMLKHTKTSKGKNKRMELLSVSRIIPYKNFHLLAEVVRELNLEYPGLSLTIIGSHPDNKYLSYLKKIKGRNVRILVNATDKTVAENYASADVYVTWDRYLFFGMPVFEAASFGRPTIAFDHAAAREVVQNGKTGIVVSTKEEFKAALRKLLDSPRQRNIMGKNASTFVKSYTWEKSARKYLEIFGKWKKN